MKYTLIIALLFFCACNSKKHGEIADDSPTAIEKVYMKDFNLVQDTGFIPVRVISYSAVTKPCTDTISIAAHYICVNKLTGDTIRLIEPCSKLITEMIEDGYIYCSLGTGLTKEAYIKVISESTDLSEDDKSRLLNDRHSVVENEVSRPFYYLAFSKNKDRLELSKTLKTYIGQFKTDTSDRTTHFYFDQSNN